MTCSELPLQQEQQHLSGMPLDAVPHARLHTSNILQQTVFVAMWSALTRAAVIFPEVIVGSVAIST